MGLDVTDMRAIVDKFWEEFKHFQNQTGPFAKKSRWNTPDVKTGKSYALAFTLH